MQTPPEVEAAICELRRTRPRWGARRIEFELGRNGCPGRISSRITIHRVLVRHGLVDAAPRCRRRQDYRRWQREVPMELWQLDIVDGIRLADGSETKVVTGVDDHSRFCVITAVVRRATDGAVTRVTPAGPTPNFHTIEISHGKQRIAVLRHATLPLAAFADPRGEGDMTLTFVDNPGLAATSTDVSNLQVLTAGQLSAPLSQADLGELSLAEHDQIAHWQPNTIGELLFNFWD